MSKSKIRKCCCGCYKNRHYLEKGKRSWCLDCECKQYEKTSLFAEDVKDD